MISDSELARIEAFAQSAAFPCDATNGLADATLRLAAEVRRLRTALDHAEACLTRLADAKAVGETVAGATRFGSAGASIVMGSVTKYAAETLAMMRAARGARG